MCFVNRALRLFNPVGLKKEQKTNIKRIGNTTSKASWLQIREKHNGYPMAS